MKERPHQDRFVAVFKVLYNAYKFHIITSKDRGPMKEILVCKIWSGIKIKAVVDRETGQITFENNRFRLDVQANKADLFYCNSKTPLFSGYLRGNCWFFVNEECVCEDTDPYVAAIQTLYDI